MRRRRRPDESCSALETDQSALSGGVIATLPHEQIGAIVRSHWQSAGLRYLTFAFANLRSCQRQASATIDSMSDLEADHWSREFANAGSATSTAGSPGRLGDLRTGTSRRVMSRTHAMISATEVPRPVPRLRASVASPARR